MSTVHYNGQVDDGHPSFNHYFARCGSVQGWSKAHPEPFHIFLSPVSPWGAQPFGRPLAGQLRAVRRLRATRASQTAPDPKPQGIVFVRPLRGRSSAPAAPALRQCAGRALRARPRGGHRAGRGIRDDAGRVSISSRDNRQSVLSGIGITRI